jgi:hypothetical protein
MHKNQITKKVKPKRFTKIEIVTAVVKYIIENGPVTHTALEERVRGKAWYTMATFDAVMETVHRHPQISVSVRSDDVYYRQKVSRPRPAPATTHLDWSKNNYPEGDKMSGVHAIFEEYDKLCNCEMWCSRDQCVELKKKKEHYLLCNQHPTQAKRITIRYNIYYERSECR